MAGNPFRYLLLLLICGIADAAELRGPEAGVIPFGMGRAYSAAADDWLALHYNPAGLALVKAVDFQVFDLKLGASTQLIDSVSEIKTLSDNSSTGAKANTLMGKNIKGQVSNITQLTVPNLAFATIYDVNVNMDLQNLQYPTSTFRYTKDFGLVAGTGWGFGKRRLFRVGMALKFINRRGGSATLDIGEISGASTNLLDRFSQSGSGIGADFGLQHTIPLKNRWEINSSVVWHDIGRTSFGDSNSRNRPEALDDNLTAGLALRMPIGGKVNRRKARRFGQARSTHHLSAVFDYSHINLSNDVIHFPRHFHYGLNLDLPLFSVQVGANQGALCYGAGIELFGLRVAGASYAEELGSYAGQRRDRRYLISVGGILGLGKI